MEDRKHEYDFHDKFDYEVYLDSLAEEAFTKGRKEGYKEGYEHGRRAGYDEASDIHNRREYESRRDHTGT